MMNDDEISNAAFRTEDVGSAALCTGSLSLDNVHCPSPHVLMYFRDMLAYSVALSEL